MTRRATRSIASVVLVVLVTHQSVAAQAPVRVTTDTSVDGDRVDAQGDTIVPEPDADEGWALERFATRFGVLQQDSALGGYQSQAGPMNRHRPGSEYAWILQPILSARIRQDSRVHHDVYIPVDIITAASTDALDVVSTASRNSEAVNLDIYSTFEETSDRRFTLHWGGHIEEPLRSATLGLATSIDLADDNAVFAVSVDAIVDFVDQVQFTGYDPGMTTRFTGTVNASLSQLLSPTTIASVSYGLTGQAGLLHTPWNSVPLEGGDRIGDLFPHTRMRHAFVGRLAQAIPISRTFLTAQYRLYVDSFGVLAHTPEGSVTQYFGDDVSLRLSYRFHTQTSVSFWSSLLPNGFDLLLPRTADSDLVALDANEVGGTLRWYYEHAGALTARSSYLEASYYHYERSNGLFVNLISLGWGISL